MEEFLFEYLLSIKIKIQVLSFFYLNFLNTYNVSTFQLWFSINNLFSNSNINHHYSVLTQKIPHRKKVLLKDMERAILLQHTSIHSKLSFL